MQRLILLTTSLLFCFPLFIAAGALDAISADTPQLKDLKDIYRAYAIQDVISDQKELLNVEMENNGGKVSPATVNKFSFTCDSLRRLGFYSDSLKNEVGKLLAATTRSYKLLGKYGPEAPEFKKDADEYDQVVSKFWSFLTGHYPLSKFANITEEIYQQKNAKSNFTKSPKYDQYTAMMQKNLKGALKLLEQIVAETSNFQEKTIYQIELADEYILHADSLGQSMMGEMPAAAGRFKVILDKQQYCTYLYEAWLKWRTTDMAAHGFSHNSEVNNGYYNTIRERTDGVILTYIKAHPDDIIAINQFLQIATYDNVRRFGSYPYGNQNVITLQQIYGSH